MHGLIMTVQSTAPIASKNHLGPQRQRCIALTQRGMRCRNWALTGEEVCWRHQDGSGTPISGSWQSEIPSSLPDITERQLHENEKAIQRQITRRKAAQEKADEKKEKRQLEKAASGAISVAKKSNPLIVAEDVKLRTLEDCLLLIEYSVEQILDMPPSLSWAKTMIQAARTAGQLIIQAGVAEKAVEWFQDNVKLVAGIDLEQI